MTIDQARERVAEIVTELMYLLPGMAYETVMNFYWDELKFWHGKAVKTFCSLKGLR